MLTISGVLWTAVGLYFDKSKEQQREINFENRIDVGEYRDVKITESNFLELNRAFETNYMKCGFYEPVCPSVARLEFDGQLLKVSDLRNGGGLGVVGINLKMYRD